MPTPTPRSRHRMVMGGSSRHHEKLGVSFTPMKAEPGCGQTSSVGLVPRRLRARYHTTKRNMSPRAVLTATALQTRPVQAEAPAARSRERNAELTPLHATLPLHRSFQQKRRGAFTRVTEHDWKLLDAPRGRGFNCTLQCFRYSRRCKEHAVIIHAPTRHANS